MRNLEKLAVMLRSEQARRQKLLEDERKIMGKCECPQGDKLVNHYDSRGIRAAVTCRYCGRGLYP